MTRRIGLVTSWASRLGGGVFEAVVAHAALVRACGMEPVIVALEDEHSEADRARFRDAEVIFCPVRGPRMIGFAPAMAARLRRAGLDLVHLHGIWMYPSQAASHWAAATGRPYVISPHGMLDPWITGRGVAKKTVARLAYERRSWRRVALFHALTDAEAADVAAATGRTAIAVIPNAVPAADRGAGVRAPVLLSLGRIHPKKNGAALIDGWAAAADTLRPAGAELVIAGWGADEDVAGLRARISAHDGGDIRFVGPLYGEAKIRALADARFLALPSYSEGLPMAILEAWAAGTPTLMSRACNLPQGFTDGAAIDCGTDAAGVAAALRAGFALDPAAWQAMSDAARALACGPFSPDAVSALWDGRYRALIGRGRAA